ncbi:serine O-acetyltransferase [Marinobacter hydrocarbonoclasticus]|nr:serine O-acetyltransferase [Marinobacter nauticus]
MSKYKPKFYFNAVSVYRLSHYFWNVRLLRPLSRIIDMMGYLIFNCSIPASAKIGKGTFCSHRGIGVVLHKRSSIGNGCSIGTCVTLGGKGKDKPGAPTIGNNVYIGTGAKILGDVVIGDNVSIGANSVVLNDIPANSTVVGIPAKIISNG